MLGDKTRRDTRGGNEQETIRTEQKERRQKGV